MDGESATRRASRQARSCGHPSRGALMSPATPAHLPSAVAAVPAAPAAEAAAHFAAELTFETDCWDVHEALRTAGPDGPDFVLLDVRGPALFARGHVPGAI